MLTVIDGAAPPRRVTMDDGQTLVGEAQAWLAEGCDVTILVRRDGHAFVPDAGPTDLGVAVARLYAAGQYDSVAELLASTHWSKLHLIGLSELRVIIAGLPIETVQHAPVLLVRAAQFAESEQRAADVRAEWLARAEEIIEPGDPVRHILEAEVARDLIRDLEVESGRALASRVLADGDRADPVARARALHTLAKADMWEGTRDAFLRAERQLRDAISSYRMYDEVQWEATAWLELGWTHNLAGAFDRSLDAIGHSVHLLGAATSQRASTLTFQADVLVEVGRYEEAATALREAESIARDLGDHPGLAYAAWGHARLRSRQRDHAGTLAYLRQVELHRTDWYRRPAGAAFHGEAAEMLVHLGDESAAREHLARARRLGAHHHTITDVAESMLEARFGDPERARRLLATLLADPETWERNRWRYLIYAAWAAHRAGDDADASALANLAVGSVEALGRPDLLAIGEPELHAHFFGATSAVEDRWELRVLGGFEVRRNGSVVRIPPGSAEWLVQRLAVLGVCTVDEITDRLWPDADVATGRRRLRNLLNRIRVECGALIERSGTRLRLTPDADVDLTEFQRTVSAIAASPVPERAGLARVAIARANGPLLADIVDDDEVAAVRERVRRHVVGLLDLVATDAIERADHAEATRLLEHAVELEPNDESRYALLANLLVDLGRPRSAHDVVSRGLAVATDLDVEPSAELSRLANGLADLV